MDGAPRRRLVVMVTALVLAVSGCLVVVSGAPASADKPKRHHHKTVHARATVTVHVTARATVRQRARQAAKVTVERRYRVPGKGHPLGRARVTRSATAKAAARATARGKGRARAHARAAGPTRAKALALARSRARHAARVRARAIAHSHAVHDARLEAKLKARKVARRRAAAHARALATRRAKRVARWRAIDIHDPTTWVRYAPAHYTPPGGPKFNNPYAGKTKQRTLLRHVVNAIKSSPGYARPVDPRTHRRAACPGNPKYYPSTIRIAVYSIADGSFAHAIQAADRRCVSVQVLMNSHLTVVTSHSWGRIVRSLGLRKKHPRHPQRSFAHRCSNGCLGTSVLHSKIYLFSHAGHAHDTVITGSSNMTRNAVGIQWNDLYTVNDDKRLYSQFLSMFRRMVPDHRAKGPWEFRDGRYDAVFYPFRRSTPKSDKTMRALRSIKCTGVRGRAGIHGRTVLYIAMHAWFSGRGTWLAKQVRHLYHEGCYVRILYSFMSHPTYSTLTRGTGHRMVVRRVLFPGPLGLHAVKYSHMKMIAVSGRIGNNRRDRVVWTGSNNFVDKSLHADEVTLRIKSAWAYRKYVEHWKFMRWRRSSPVWAKFQEPQGGGRAP
jgi:PLD-like domain